MKKIIFIFISLLTLKCALNSSLCPIQVKCDLDKISTTCRNGSVYEGVTTVVAKRCPDGQVCTAKDIQYPGTCVARGLKIPGEACSEDNECLYGECILTCGGKDSGADCRVQEECKVGYYCYNYQCVKQKIEGSTCQSEIECENNLGCWRNKCTPYLSFPLGYNIGDMAYKHFCKTNFAVFQSTGYVLCASSRMISQYFECSDEVSYCDYLADIGAGQEYPYKLQCQCSYSDSTRRFCPLASQNQTYIDGTDALKEHFKFDASSLHTTRRMFLKSHTKNKKYQLANTFPRLYNAPECLYEALLSVSFVKISFLGLMILSLVL